MTYTPEQLTALNRAIAEYEGYDYDKEFFDWQHLSGVGGAPFHLNYTTSLDTITEVVREWIYKQEYKPHIEAEKMFAQIWRVSSKLGWPFTYDQPALALCIAFAQAAGLKGEWYE
jgi:hypothetical protein